jgi:peptidoglycan/LPS O-acetylase OafA/YrhL
VRYNPALDGLRAIAMLAVLAFHSRAPFALSGYLGVDLFFVLSGFLITSILVAEYREAGSIDVWRFYWRRALRLYPTLLLLLAAFLIAAPFVWSELPAWRYAAWAAFYLSDYSKALLGEPVVLSYTWSLSVEEHFYLLWPLVLPLVLRAGNPARVLVIAYLLATAWRIGNYLWLGWEPAYFRFDTRLSGLILGCLLAFWQPNVGRWVPIALLSLCAVMVMDTFMLRTGLTAAVPAVEIASAVLVLACVTAPERLRAIALLAYLGRLSYGMYLWHFPLVYWMRDRYEWPVTLAVGGLFAVAMAALTYHFVDVPLRRLRMRPAPVAAAQGAT